MNHTGQSETILPDWRDGRIRELELENEQLQRHIGSLVTQIHGERQRPEEVPKFALDSQIEITNQERASKEHAEGVIRALLKDRDRIIEQCATVCDEHARTNAKLPYHQAAAKFLARRIRELSASSPQNARGGGGGSSN